MRQVTHYQNGTPGKFHPYYSKHGPMLRSDRAHSQPREYSRFWIDWQGKYTGIVLPIIGITSGVCSHSGDRL